MWKFRVLLFAIVGISVGSAIHPETKDDFKKLYRDFDNNQDIAMTGYAETYREKKQLTFEKIVRKHTMAKQELAKDLSTLEGLSMSATVDTDDELARIGNKFKNQTIMMDSVRNATMLSRDLKYLTVIQMIQKPESPITTILRKTIIKLTTATSPKDLEDQHTDLYNLLEENYTPFFMRVPAQLDIITDYHKKPLLFPVTSIAKMDELIDKIVESMKKWTNNDVKNEADLETLLKLLPEFLSEWDLLQDELKTAQVECDLVRCKKHSDSQNPPPSAFGKLVEKLEKLEQENLKAINHYHDNGFNTFEKFAKQYSLTAEQKDLMKNTPKDQSPESNRQVKEAYNQLESYEFKLPMVNSPTRLADAFKIAVLLDFVLKKKSDLLAENQIKTDIKKIIDEEKKINRKFDQPSKTLEDLYVEMEKNHYFELMYSSEGYIKTGENFQDYCDKNAGACDADLTSGFRRYFEIHKLIQEASPVDSAEKVDKLLKDIKEFNELDGVLNEAARHHHLNCRLPSGCEKAE